MFDNSNHYALRTEIIGGIMYYFVAFEDGQAIHRETEVSRPVYLEFQRFIKIERNLRRWDERRIEQSTMTEEMLYDRALYKPKNIDETIFESFQNIQLKLAIESLSEIQRRRFILHYVFGLTYAQISSIEGCSTRSVEYSVSLAKEKIKKYFVSGK